MNKDQIEGKVTRTVGVVKEKAGEALGDPQLVEEGRDDQVSGRVQEVAGKAKDAVDTVRKTVDQALVEK